MKPATAHQGFTLIELLIVVAIIAILALIAVPDFLEAQMRAKISRVRTDMRTVVVALESYFADSNTCRVPLCITSPYDLVRLARHAARRSFMPLRGAPLSVIAGRLPCGER